MVDTAAVKAIYELAKEQGWISQLFNIFKTKYTILVLGTSGVGKTNFLQSLTTLIPEVIDYTARTTSSHSIPIAVRDVPFIFVDTPGEDDYRRNRTDAILKHINSLSAVINVVAYGYHEYRAGLRDAFTATNEINAKYLELNRVREINAVGEWSQILGGAHGHRLITVVTKADLWWDREHEVTHHYKEGNYYQGLGRTQHLEQIVLPYCSVFHKFYGKGKLAGTYDEKDRNLQRTNLLRALFEITGQ